MPILDVTIVKPAGQSLDDRLARRIADAAGDVLNTPPGRTWVRLHHLPCELYAENGSDEPEGLNAVFVSVLKAKRPSGTELKNEVERLAEAVAQACGRQRDNIHILYEPDGAGRIAFGGVLVPATLSNQQ